VKVEKEKTPVPVKIAVLGAGPGGYVAAIRAAQFGADVTLMEEENIGGTCLNWGCIPSKVLITTADLLEKIRKADAFGITVEGNVCADMSRLMQRKNKVIQDQSKGILDLLKHHRIHYVKGTGSIKGKGLAVVRLQEGSEQEVPWEKLILATGTRPSPLPGIPFDGEKILSSNHALALQDVPESILIVGGGVIGCEFAFLLSALGSKVTVIEALSRLLPLPSVDENCSKVLHREMKKRKINFMVSHTLEALSEVDGKLRATILPSPFLESPAERNNQSLFVIVDKILVCIGRTPNSTNLEGFDRLGVRLDEKGWVVTNHRMETSVSDVYAVGDLLGPSKIMLAHVASAEGAVAAENAMGGQRDMDYSAVPSAIFTSPEIANVGLTEAQALEHGYEVRSDTVLFRSLGKAQVLGDIAGEAKIVSESVSGRILGVHLIGPHATDLIAEATLAVRIRATVQDLASTIHAHPTLAEIMAETSLKAMDRPLHG
jgi:dihydrolipoamide dehydrogenase